MIQESEAQKAAETVLTEIGELRWEPPSSIIGKGKVWRPDLVGKLKVGGKDYTLLFELKNSGGPRTIAETAGYFSLMKNGIPGYPVLVAPFIGQRGMETCKKLDIGCIDLAGNARIKIGRIFIESTGKENRFKEKQLQKSLFSEKSARIIRRLLSFPSRKWKLLDIALVSGVSLAQAFKVLEKLESEGFVEKKWGQNFVKKPVELIEYWAQSYYLKDQKIVGYYCPVKSQDGILQVLKAVSSSSYALTLGAASSIVAPSVRSTDVYIYVRGDQSMIMEALRLKPVEFGGNVYLITPKTSEVFFDSRQMEGLMIVSDLQLYLDLYKYPMRGREQADAIIERIRGAWSQSIV